MEWKASGHAVAWPQIHRVGGSKEQPLPFSGFQTHIVELRPQLRHIPSRRSGPRRESIRRWRWRATGYAGTRPLRPDDSAEGTAANRRVELIMESRAR